MTQQEARGIANAFGIPLGRDFHALNSDIVQRISDAAKSRAYRKPANANGSKARYFYAFLNRSNRDA